MRQIKMGKRRWEDLKRECAHDLRLARTRQHRLDLPWVESLTKRSLFLDEIGFGLERPADTCLIVEPKEAA